MPRPPVDVLWCSNRRAGKGLGWQFPPGVERELLKLSAGKSVLQLFGGRSRFGLKLDIDTATAPHVIGDAWLPPFRRDAFQVVIIDPPYVSLNQQMKQQLLQSAAYCASEYVVWFHTMWIANSKSCKLERAWLVRVGDSCVVRCIQVFRTTEEKTAPSLHFTRGPAIRYNRWLAGAQRLPFGPAVVSSPLKHRAKKAPQKAAAGEASSSDSSEAFARAALSVAGDAILGRSSAR